MAITEREAVEIIEKAIADVWYAGVEGHGWMRRMGELAVTRFGESGAVWPLTTRFDPVSVYSQSRR